MSYKDLFSGTGPKGLVAVCIVLLILMPQAALATEPARPASAVQPPGPNDTAALKTFIDGEMQEQMKEDNIPGSAIVIVKNGSILYEQGYGYADLENKTPVAANKTLFRIGSVTKLFTATAVMQQSRGGKLDLNADVNTYLKDFKVPATYPQPITLNNLLTHTAGFEDLEFYGRGETLDQGSYEPLGEHLARTMPARVLPPGEAASYSNYGMSLAGYVVEQVSGTPYDQYINQNILEPLDMDHSSASQPLPADLQADLSKGYTYFGGNYSEVGFEYVQLSPSGAISSTAEDMGHFMIAQLNNGSYGGARILDEPAAIGMQSRHFSDDPRMADGYCYAFADSDWNGKRTLCHDGGTLAFTSFLILIPSEDVGIFISSNSPGGNILYSMVINDFIDRYYPAPAADPARPMAGYRERAASYAGTYYPLRSSFTTNEKLFADVSQIGVTANANGTINLLGSDMVEVEPDYFQAVNGTGTVIFREDDSGRIDYLFCGFGDGPLAYARAEWYQTFLFHLALLVLCEVVFLSAIIGWPAKHILDRVRHNGKKSDWKSGPALAKWTALIALVLSAVVTESMVGIVAMELINQGFLASNVPVEMYIVVALALIRTVLVIPVIAFMVMAWKDKYWGLWGRIHYTLVTLALIAFTWLLYYYNLIGFNF